jgi:hypothetical protein
LVADIRVEHEVFCGLSEPKQFSVVHFAEALPQFVQALRIV